MYSKAFASSHHPNVIDSIWTGLPFPPSFFRTAYSCAPSGDVESLSQR